MNGPTVAEWEVVGLILSLVVHNTSPHGRRKKTGTNALSLTSRNNDHTSAVPATRGGGD